MSNIPLFREKQQGVQWWIWLVMLGLNGLAWYGLVQQLILGIPFGNNPMSDQWLILFAAFMLVLSLFLFSINLETIITEAGIKVRLWPLHLKYRFFTWDQISNAKIRRYHPLLEYGGWGIRLGIKGKGWAYNLSGNYGLQLQFKNGKKLLIGTNKPTEIEKVLNQMRST
jgi:hypothetical protein